MANPNRIKWKSIVLDTITKTLTDNAGVMGEVEIKNKGGLMALGLVVTQSTTGTLVTPNPIDRALQLVSLKDSATNPIFSSIRGQDLAVLEHMFGQFGVNTAVPDTANSANKRKYILPVSIKREHLTAKLQITVAPYSAMAASGATGGSVTVKVIGIYGDGMEPEKTTRYFRAEQEIASGTKSFGNKLTKQRLVSDGGLVGVVTTESNITSITFSADGGEELQAMTMDDFAAHETQTRVSGHVTGRFKIPHMAFVPTEETVLDVDAAGTDTIHWIQRCLG